MRFRDFLPEGEAPSAAALAAALELAEAAKATAAERIATLNQRRAEALVSDAAERDLDKIETDLTKATRDRARAALAGEELRRRLVEAEERERVAALDAAYEAGLAAQKKGVQLITKRYRKLATELAKVLDELSDCEHAIHQANETLHKSGDGRKLEACDYLARPRLYRPQLVAPSLTTATVLPHFELPECTLYPASVPPNYGPVHRLVRPARSWSDRPTDEQPVAPPATVGWFKEQPTW